MDTVKNTYSDFHRRNKSKHIYPTEWVIRTILGKYPKLNLDKSKYEGSKILDLGFGDARNMTLLDNCKFDIYGLEITNEIIASTYSLLAEMQIQATLREGTNANIPFEKSYFDYVLACHSCYYVDKGTSFDDNLSEVSRVLKSGGIFIASLPAPDNFILKDCQKLSGGHVVITNDLFNLRNGYIFRTFESESEVVDCFSPFFKDILVTKCVDNFWGLQINFFIIVGTRI